MTLPRFIHLRVHTAYSLLEGAIQVKALPGMAQAAGMPAVAVTDSGNLFAALEFSETAAKAGVQPILGAQMPLASTVAARPGEQLAAPRSVVLLAQNEVGYENLLKLSSCYFLESGEALPHLTMDELAAHSAGLICLTGGPDGPLGRLIRAGQGGKATASAATLARGFPDPEDHRSQI